jgi:acyl-CoA synthetase (AMP-forming)/AMP-acid ligase II
MSPSPGARSAVASASSRNGFPLHQHQAAPPGRGAGDSGRQHGKLLVAPDDSAVAAHGLLTHRGLAGLTLVTVNPAYQADELAHVLGHSGARGIFLGASIGGVPTMLTALLDHPGRAQRDLSCLRYALSGGATVPAELVRQVEAAFGVPFVITFAQTESSCSITMQPLPRPPRPSSPDSAAPGSPPTRSRSAGYSPAPFP